MENALPCPCCSCCDIDPSGINWGRLAPFWALTLPNTYNVDIVGLTSNFAGNLDYNGPLRWKTFDHSYFIYPEATGLVPLMPGCSYFRTKNPPVVFYPLYGLAPAPGGGFNLTVKIEYDQVCEEEIWTYTPVLPWNYTGNNTVQFSSYTPLGACFNETHPATVPVNAGMGTFSCQYPFPAIAPAWLMPTLNIGDGAFRGCNGFDGITRLPSIGYFSNLYPAVPLSAWTFLGTHIVGNTSFSCWLYYDPTQPAWELSFDVLLGFPRQPQETHFALYRCTTFDPLNPNTFNLISTSAYCTNWPNTITITPDFSGQ